jgi:hypothetical protein
MANLITNYSFESNLDGWVQTGSTSDVFLRSQTLSAAHGVWYATKEASGTGSRNLDYTGGINVTPGQTYSWGARLRWIQGATPRNIRLDVRWLNNIGTIFQTDTGSTGAGANIIPTTGSWSLINTLNVTAPTTGDPATSAYGAQVRIALLSAALGDAYALDAVQFNGGATLEPLGSESWSTVKFIRLGT